MLETYRQPHRKPDIRRRYDGPLDSLRPTFYISAALGEKPADLVRDLIGEDSRFFAPMPEVEFDDGQASTDHNYNDNTNLARPIESGARGAYWDIPRELAASECARGDG